MPHGLGAINVGEMLALPSFATEKAKTARSLPAAADELVDNVSATITELVLYAIEQRSAGAFTEARAKVFPKYFDTVLGLSFLLPVLVPEHVLEVRANESFSEIEMSFARMDESPSDRRFGTKPYLQLGRYERSAIFAGR